LKIKRIKENKKDNMVNYQNSKIYSIRSRTGDDIYIGSTSVGISKRFSKHHECYKYWIKNDNKKKYYSSFFLFEKYDIADIYYELVQECPCDNKEQLRKIEGEYIRKYMKEGVCCNKLIAGRSKKEYGDALYLENKDKIQEKRKKYHIENPTKRQENSKRYYDLNKDKANERYLKNKEAIDKRTSKYYFANKTKTTCECGSIVGTQSIKKHRESDKHFKLLNEI
jgi:hypothetical protein